MKFFDKFKIFDKKPVSPDDQEVKEAEQIGELEISTVAPENKAGSSLSPEEIDELTKQVQMSREEIAELMGENIPEPFELPEDIEAEPGMSFGEKFSQKMKDIYEKSKEISARDIKTFFTKERESQVVETGGKIAYDTLGTITGTKFISDFGLYLLHKAGVKSSIKGDIHKYFAENDMERALVGITNKVVSLRKHKEEIKNLGVDERKAVMDEVKPELKKAIQKYREKVENLNVSEEKKKALRLELSSIIRDHKEQESTIAKGESEKFEQVMRHYTGNKVSGLKIGKDALNSALSLSGFYAVRGASYLVFSGLEKGKESWDKKSRELYNAKREEIKISKKTEDMPDWTSNYYELSGDKMKAVLKGVTIDSAKETYNELVHGRKEGKSDEAKERKENFKVEKSANIEMLKQHLEEEGVGLFGRTWRVNWERVKNLNPETIKENLMRLQALGKIARVVGVSLVGIQAYETDGSMFKGAYDKLLDSIEKGETKKALLGNMYGNVARLADAYDKTAEKLHEAKIFDLKTWQDGYHHIAEKFHHTDETGHTALEKEGLESSGVKTFNIEKDGTSTPAVHENELGGSGASVGNAHVEVNSARINELSEKINLVRAAHTTPGAGPMSEVEKNDLAVWEKEKNILMTKDNGAVDSTENPEGQIKVPDNASTSNHFQITEKVTIGKGDKIWSVAEKHLEGNSEFHKLKGFLRTYNIDRVKDTIVAHPEKYGLKVGFNERKMSVADLEKIDWHKAFDDTFHDKGVTTRLPKGHRGGGDHHHPAAKPRIAKPSGRMFTERESAPRRDVELPKEFGKTEAMVADSHPEAPKADNLYRFDENTSFEKGSQGERDFLAWEKLSVEDVMNGKFGKPIGYPEFHHEEPAYLKEYGLDTPRPEPKLDALQIKYQHLLQERLKNAHDLIGDPKKGQTVGQYIAKYNLENANKSGELFKRLQNEGIIRGGASVKYQFINTINKLPSEMKNQLLATFFDNKKVALGYVKLFAGDRSGLYEGIKDMFSHQGEVISADIHLNANGSITYENAFGKKGYDLIIHPDKIAVDGPGWNNWNIHGAKLNLENIRDAKAFILSGKTMSDNIDDISGHGHGGVKVNHEAAGSEAPKAHVETSVKAGTEVKPVVEKNDDTGIEKSAGKGGVNDVNMKKLQEPEKKAESLEKDSSTIKPGKKDFYI